MKAKGLSISQKLNFGASTPTFAMRFPTMGDNPDYFDSNSGFALFGGVVAIDPWAVNPYLDVLYDPIDLDFFSGNDYREISFKVALESFSGSATFKLSFTPIAATCVKSITETFVAGEPKTIIFRMNRDDLDELTYVESSIYSVRLTLDRTSDNGFSVSEMYIKRYIPNIVTWGETIDRRSPLNPALSMNKLGGIDELSFSADKADALLLYKDSLLSVDYNGVRLGYAYVTELGDAQSTEGPVPIRAAGFARRLSEVVVDTDYSALTFADMIADLPWWRAGVFYHETYIELPTGLPANGWNIEGDTLYDVAKKIIDILNISLATEEYIFQVNADRYIEIKAMDVDLDDRLIEGIDFHVPAGTQDSSLIVNTVRAYRTKAVDTTDLEYVGTYTDAGSIVENGEKSKDLIVSSYMETTTIARMAAFILSKYSTPVKKIAIGTFPGIVPFARYGVQYKSRGTEFVLIEGVSVNEIEDTYSPFNFVTLRTTEAASGRTMLYVGSSNYEHPEVGYGDTAELVHPVFGATALRIRGIIDWQWADKDTAFIRIAIYDSLGNVFTTNLAAADYGAGFITVDIPITNVLLAATAIYGTHETDGDVAVYESDGGDFAIAEATTPANFLTNVSKIRFTTPLGGGIKIDRMSLLKKTTRTDYVPLEKVTYKFSKGIPVAALELGARSDSLVDEFIELAKDAETLKRVFAK